MRISDWSSAVCSSDLGTAAPGGDSCLSRGAWLTPLRHAVSTRRRVRKVPVLHAADHGGCSFGNPGCVCIGRLVCAVAHRSEEHTSELQSLMRISYAVFCLKKKKQATTHSTHNHIVNHTLRVN